MKNTDNPLADEARTIAEEALSRASVTDETWDEAAATLDFSMNNYEREKASPFEIKGEAFALSVVFEIKDALETAGYPDSDRAVEVFYRYSCA